MCGVKLFHVSLSTGYAFVPILLNFLSKSYLKMEVSPSFPCVSKLSIDQIFHLNQPFFYQVLGDKRIQPNNEKIIELYGIENLNM